MSWTTFLTWVVQGAVTVVVVLLLAALTASTVRSIRRRPDDQ